MSAAGLSVGTAVAKAPPPQKRRRLSPARLALGFAAIVLACLHPARGHRR